LRFGGLPGVIDSDEPREDLSAYVTQYINEEVKLESNVRKIDFFHRFLEVAALYSSEIVNFANIASDIGVSEPTVKSYYQILKDVAFNFWRSLEKDEVDFVLDDNIAIEVKASKKVKTEHLKGLKKIKDVGTFKKL
jgi:predicted AAA+ superfamily ATPase